MIGKIKTVASDNWKYAVWEIHDYGGGASAVYDEVMEAVALRYEKPMEKQ